MTTLKPCPFCGAPAVLRRDPGSYGYRSPSYRVSCTDQRGCGVDTMPVDEEKWAQGKGTTSHPESAKAQAIALWNRRA